MRTILNGLMTGFTEEGEGPPLVFLHGFPLDRDIWMKQIRAFRSDWRVILPDLRGFGESEGTPGPVSMARLAEDVHDLLRHLGAGPAVLVGHSMGGYVALAFARAFPQALRGLVLVGTKAGADAPEAAVSRRAMAAKVEREGTAFLLKAMAAKMLAPGNRDETMTVSITSFMRPNRPEGLISALLGMAERPDARTWLADLHVPTLVLAGREDALIPIEEAGVLARGIPGAELQLLDRAGHLVAYEQPYAFNEALRLWADRLAPSASREAAVRMSA